MNKKRIVITITHRTDTIEILSHYLNKQRTSFDEWHIWLNSSDEEIKKYLSQQLDAIIIQPDRSNPLDKLENLHIFYKQDAVDINTNYLKLDDDIVWLEPSFIENIFSKREVDSEHFLIYPNIINNSVLSNIHMRFGNIPWNDRCWYNFMDPVGWGNPLFAEMLHNIFISDLKNNTYHKWHFNRWNLDYKEQISINSICWTGADFSRFAQTMVGNDEFWINNYGPSLVNKQSIIDGSMICSHYAFHPQKSHLDSTSILEEYKKLAYSV